MRQDSTINGRIVLCSIYALYEIIDYLYEYLR